MGSTKENESENKIRHKGQHLPTKTTQTRFTPKGNIRENRKMRSTDVGYEILEFQSIF